MKSKIDAADSKRLSFDELPSTVLAIYRKLEAVENYLSKLNQTDTTTLDDLLCVDQAAIFLRLSRQRVYTLVSERKIPFMKRSKRLYFSRKSLVLWLNETERRVAA
jgi:hypothetical protein